MGHIGKNDSVYLGALEAFDWVKESKMCFGGTLQTEVTFLIIVTFPTGFCSWK